MDDWVGHTMKLFLSGLSLAIAFEILSNFFSIAYAEEASMLDTQRTIDQLHQRDLSQKYPAKLACLRELGYKVKLGYLDTVDGFNVEDNGAKLPTFVIGKNAGRPGMYGFLGNTPYFAELPAIESSSHESQGYKILVPNSKPVCELVIWNGSSNKKEVLPDPNCSSPGIINPKSPVLTVNATEAMGPDSEKALTDAIKKRIPFVHEAYADKVKGGNPNTIPTNKMNLTQKQTMFDPNTQLFGCFLCKSAFPDDKEIASLVDTEVDKFKKDPFVTSLGLTLNAKIVVPVNHTQGR